MAEIIKSQPSATQDAPLSFSVQGKTAIVTGAGSGISFSFAALLLCKGCNVVIGDLALRPEAQQLITQFTSRDGSEARAIFQKTDVTQWVQLEALFEFTYKEFNTVDIVCSGAGVFEPPFSSFWHPPGTSQSKDTVDGNRYMLLDVNLLHPIRTSQLAMQYFLQPPSGSPVSAANPKRIILISSIAAQGASIAYPLYNVSKAGVNSFTRSMAMLEGSHGIRVNAVAPGVTDTPLFRENANRLGISDQNKDKWVKPETVAEVLLESIESNDIPGGTVIEVGYEYTRRVTQYNDAGPQGRPGSTAGTAKAALDETYKLLNEPGWGKST